MDKRGRVLALDQTDREWAWQNGPAALAVVEAYTCLQRMPKGHGAFCSQQINHDLLLSGSEVLNYKKASCPPSIAEGEESALTCPWRLLFWKNI